MMVYIYLEDIDERILNVCIKEWSVFEDIWMFNLKYHTVDTCIKALYPINTFVCIVKNKLNFKRPNKNKMYQK